MKREKILSGGLVLTLLSALALNSGCEKSEPPLVWDPNQQSGAAPFISSANPPSSAIGGVTQVTLTGGNFVPVDTQNLVYFGGARAKVVSGTPTQLVVVAPDTVASGLSVRVAVPGALSLAVYSTPYAIEKALGSYGDFTPVDEVYSIAVDGSENLYAQLAPPDTSTPPKVFMVTPSGTKTLYSTLDKTFPKASEMKMGPGGYLYLQQTNNVKLWRIPPCGGPATVWVTLPGKAGSIDFDSVGNLYAGGTSAGLFVVAPNGTSRSVGAYLNISIRSVRVFAGAVYLLVDSPTKRVYKNAILNTNGDLGPNTVAFDWANAGSAYTSASLFALTFAANGDMVIGTNVANPIVIVHPDGSSEPLYPGVIPTQITQSLQFAWGTGTSLYVNRDNPGTNVTRGVSKLSMGENGAPYYGRN